MFVSPLGPDENPAEAAEVPAKSSTEAHKINISLNGDKYAKVVLEVINTVASAKRPFKTHEVILIAFSN